MRNFRYTKENKYIATNNNKILIKNTILNNLKSIDTIVFDVDGVLVNSEKSFIEAICRTVNFYYKNVLKFDTSENLIEPKEVYFFKDAGGFNNDYDLTSAIILFYLMKYRKYGSKNISVLKEKPPNLKILTTKMFRLGGGLQNMFDLLNKINIDDKNWILNNWNKDLIEKIFKEIYAGSTLCKELYGFSPSILKSSGLIDYERILIEEKQKIFLRAYCLGILTGRSQGETNVILNKLNWQDILGKDNIYTSDDGPEKPNPQGLVKISKNCNTNLGLFIGDIWDDLFTVKYFNKLTEKQGIFYSCIIKSVDFGLAEEPVYLNTYLDNDVDIVANSVNYLLSWLKESVMVK